MGVVARSGLIYGYDLGAVDDELYSDLNAHAESIIGGLRAFPLSSLAHADGAAYALVVIGPWLREGPSEQRDYQAAIGRAHP